MPGLSTLTVFLNANTNKFNKGLNGAIRSTKKFEAQVNFAAKAAVAGISAATILFSKNAVKLASDAEEIANKFDVVFSELSLKANTAAKNLADSFGLASSSAKKLLGDVGDILTGFGFTQKEALDLSKQVNELAVDLASFTNFAGGAEGASKALTKALLGEAESVKALGIVIRQDTEEYKNLVKQIQETNKVGLVQAKALAALKIATEQSKNAIGDYARTQKSFANQSRLLNEQYKEFRELTGEVILKTLALEDSILDLNSLFERLNNTIKKNGLEWVNTIKIFSAEFTAAFKQVALFAEDGFKFVTTNFFILVDTIDRNWRGLWNNAFNIFGAFITDSVDLLFNFSESLVKFFKDPLQGFDFANIFVDLGVNLENAVKKAGMITPEFLSFEKELNKTLDRSADIQKQKQKDIENFTKKSFEKINKAKKDAKIDLPNKTVVSVVADKTSFAAALEKGSIEASRAELKDPSKNPAAKTADNTGQIVEINKRMLDMQKQNQTVTISIPGAGAATA